MLLVVLADPFQQVESKKDKRAKVSSQQSIISTRPNVAAAGTVTSVNTLFALQVEEQRKKDADQQRRSGVDTRRAAPGFPGGRGGRGGRFEGRGGRGRSQVVTRDGPCRPCCAVRCFCPSLEQL
jgi:hypothetical protein